jgi:hypothetical protein
MSLAKIIVVSVSLGVPFGCAVRSLVLQTRFSDALKRAFPAVWKGFLEYEPPWWNNDQDPSESACRSYVLHANYRSLNDSNVVKLGEQCRRWVIATYSSLAIFAPVMFLAP